MDTPTHAMLPVIIVAGWDLRHGRLQRLTSARYLSLALFGALPDLLNPHLSLEARHASWSHGLPFLATLALAVVVAAYALPQRISLRFACLLVLAYALHLACDAVAGGIAWLYPFSDHILGRYFVPPAWWIGLDFVCALTIYFLFRAIPGWQRNRRVGLQQQKTRAHDDRRHECAEQQA
jgi:hypothetical protein